MSKAELLKFFGRPNQIGKVRMPHQGFFGTHATLLTFSGKMCANDYSCSSEAICDGGSCHSGGNGLDKACFYKGTCGVALDDDEVIHIVNFSLDYTEDLK